MKKRNINFKILIKILFSLLILFFLIYFLDFKTIYTSFLKVSLTALIISTLLNHFAWILSSWKLNLLLKNKLPILIRLHYISILFSYILPGQIAGEGYKLIKISKDSGYSKASSIIIIDRITGFIGIVILATFGIFLSSKEIPDIIKILFILSNFLLLLPFLIIGKIQILIEKYLKNSNAKRSKYLIPLQNFISHWILLQKNKIRFLALIVSGVFFQFILVYINYFLGKSIGINIPIYDWLWIFGLISLALFLPVTYAGLGIREASMISLLGLFSIEPEKSMLLSFLILGIQLTGVSIGFLMNLQSESQLSFKISDES